MKRFKGFLVKLIWSFCFALLLEGCVIGRYYEGPKIPQEKIQEIKPGIDSFDK